MAAEIVNYIAMHWVGWLFAVLTAFVGFAFKSILKTIKHDREENKALREGMQALLRDGIIRSFNKYSELGYCPIYAKENVKRMYSSYHALGGNDVATELCDKLMTMPTEEDEDNTENPQ